MIVNNAQQTKTTPPKAISFNKKDFEGVRFIPHDFKTVVSLDKKTHMIWLSEKIITDMLCVAGLVEKEVSWLGIVDRTNNGFFISEIFVPEQIVSAAETEMTEEGIFDIAQKIMSEENGIEKINKLRFWCHTHPWGGTGASGQDDTQSKKFIKDVDDFFIRGIATKKGKIEFTLYLIDKQLVIKDAPWGMITNNIDNSIKTWLEVVGQNVKEKAPAAYNWRNDYFGNGVKMPGDVWCSQSARWVPKGNELAWCYIRKYHIMQKILDREKTHEQTMNEKNQILINDDDVELESSGDVIEVDFDEDDKEMEEYIKSQGYHF